MWSFLSEFTRASDEPSTIIVMDDEFREQPRQYHVRPRRLLIVLSSMMVGGALFLLSLVVFTPLREFIPGYGTVELRQNARLAAVRLAALQDSLAVQGQYITQLRYMLTGQVDSTLGGSEVFPEPSLTVSGELAEVAVEPNSENWADHEQPALPIASMPVSVDVPVRARSTGNRYLSSLRLPVLPPVSGIVTREFDARTGHYAIDIAVEEGTMVRAIGEGYVIFADWTHEGGYAITVQHADGYVSVYKHNQRLLKRVGDRVHAREGIAISGNSGEFTTGPHLHVELWDNGLAQDPMHYFVGL